MFRRSENDHNRKSWLTRTIGRLPAGSRLLDAGAGELRNRSLCSHLSYVSQDFCQYTGVGNQQGLQNGAFDTTGIDLVCDITEIPEPDAAFDAILCSEVLEHIPDPLRALDEFARLLKPGGMLLLTAPFASIVHMAPHYFCSGFSRYWYEHHLTRRGFRIEELAANGDWFDCCEQELMRLGSTARRYGDCWWPVAYVVSLAGGTYFKLRGGKRAEDLSCFGWHCAAVRDA